MAVRIHRACLCSHTRSSHEHYRAGTDCALCDCSRYKGRYVITGRIPQPREELAEPYVTEVQQPKVKRRA